MDTLKSLIDFSWASQPAAWIGLLTLIALEVVLGIDNIVFISILSGKLPEAQQAKARKQGLILAVIPRVIFLFFLGLILQLQKPLFYLPVDDPAGHSLHPKGWLGLNGQELVLIIGGLFLLVQAVREIHHATEPDEEKSPTEASATGGAKLRTVLTQIMFMNIIFSLDSIVTAIGMVPKEQVMVMIIAVLVSTLIMIYAVGPIGNFVQRHPTVKMLALAFLVLIGTNLLGEAFHFHIPKGYVYFAMAFSVFVEMLNIRAKHKQTKLAESAPEVQ
jgi:predicted tellurium resistance membrane protein TerC